VLTTVEGSSRVAGFGLSAGRQLGIAWWAPFLASMECQLPSPAEEETVPNADRPRRAVTAALLAAVAAGAVVAVGPLGPACRIGCPARAATVAPAAATQRPSPAPSRVTPSRVTAAALVKPVDELRIRSGCRPLVRDDVLRRTARAHAVALDEQGGVSHVDSVGGTAQDRVRRQGYRGDVVELVATGTLRPGEFGTALAGLVDRTDLLDCRFRSVGAAMAGRHLVVVLGDR